MKTFVVDTSALLRVYLPDGQIPEEIEPAIDAAWHGEALLIAPELLLAELGQVLLKKERFGYISCADADQILDEILALPIDIAEHVGLLRDAIKLARNYSLTVYDALYLALAQKEKAVLITADELLKKAAERTL